MTNTPEPTAPDADLESAYEDRFHVADDDFGDVYETMPRYYEDDHLYDGYYDHFDSGHYDDDPSPYDGTYSEM